MQSKSFVLDLLMLAALGTVRAHQILKSYSFGGPGELGFMVDGMGSNNLAS
jgi:hypothetical protein